MRILPILALVFFFAGLTADAQSDQATATAIPDRGYQLLREDEDWSFLSDPAFRQDFWDPVKYIRLRRGSDDWFLTISGEAREMWEQIGNDYWGQGSPPFTTPSLFWNAYLDQRYML